MSHEAFPTPSGTWHRWCYLLEPDFPSELGVLVPSCGTLRQAAGRRWTSRSCPSAVPTSAGTGTHFTHNAPSVRTPHQHLLPTLGDLFPGTLPLLSPLPARGRHQVRLGALYVRPPGPRASRLPAASRLCEHVRFSPVFLCVSPTHPCGNVCPFLLVLSLNLMKGAGDPHFSSLGVQGSSTPSAST